MVDEIGSEGPLDEQLARLEESLGGAGAMIARFDEELGRMAATLNEAGGSVGAFSTRIDTGVRRAFEGVVFGGASGGEALRSVAQSVAGATYQAAVRPATGRLGDLVASGLGGFGAAAFADGGAFAQGRVMPFARGGVVSGPVAFPMRGGTGLMGEAGPEAILPLERGADGALGVRAGAGGARPVQVVMNVTTPDVAGFRRSSGQIAAQVGRALARGERNR